MMETCQQAQVPVAIKKQGGDNSNPHSGLHSHFYRNGPPASVISFYDDCNQSIGARGIPQSYTATAALKGISFFLRRIHY